MQHGSSVNHKFCSIPMELSFLHSGQRHKDSLTVFYESVNFMADLFSKIVLFSKLNFHTTCSMFYMMLTEVKTYDNKVETAQSFVNMYFVGGKCSLQQTVGFTHPDGDVPVVFYLIFNLNCVVLK